MLNSPDFIFQTCKRVKLVTQGVANTAISADTGLTAALNLKSNEFAEMLRGTVVLEVTGANADGDDEFLVWIHNIGYRQCHIWHETIAAATLVQNAIVWRDLPYTSYSTTRTPIYFFSDEAAPISATAGGAGVIYKITIFSTWAIWKRVIADKPKGVIV